MPKPENGGSGEYTDAETGFVYLRARYSDPATSQFISRDPLVALTGSAYGYVVGNPLNLTDSTGLLPGQGLLTSIGNGLRAAGCWISDGVTQAAAYVYDHRAGITQGMAVAGAVMAAIAIAPIGAAALSVGLSSLAGSIGMSGTAAMFAAEIGGFAAIANTVAVTSFVLSTGSTFLTCQDGLTTACKISFASTSGGGALSGIGAATQPLFALLAAIGSFFASLAGTHSPAASGAS